MRIKGPRFVLFFKPSVTYAIAGAVIRKPGRMNRYLPAIARAVEPDVAVVLGLVWAGLMFVSVAANAFVALTCSMATSGLMMPIFGIVTKVAVFLVGFAAIYVTDVCRLLALPAFERDALIASTGRS